MKFPAAPVSTRAVETTPEGHPEGEVEITKGLAENDVDGILKPTPYDHGAAPLSQWTLDWEAPDTAEAGAPL